MMKRLFAIVLCLAMLLSYAVPAVSAAGTNTGNTDDIYLGDGATINEFNTEDSEESNSPVVGDTSGKVPECSCGSKADIADHADSCTLKNYYHGLSCQTAEKLYDQWENFSEDVRNYILQCLNECDHEKLAYLQSMINTDLSGKDSAQMGDAVIHVSGIPVGGSLTVVPMIQTPFHRDLCHGAEGGSGSECHGRKTLHKSVVYLGYLRAGFQWQPVAALFQACHRGSGASRCGAASLYGCTDRPRS